MDETLPRPNNARVENDRRARGARNGRAKLNDRLVARARALFKQDPKKYSAIALADLYAVSRFVMWSALSGRTWKHVPEAGEITRTDATSTTESSVAKDPE